MTEQIGQTPRSGSANLPCQEQPMFSEPQQLFEYVTSPENTAAWTVMSADGLQGSTVGSITTPQKMEKPSDQLAQLAAATNVSRQRIQKLDSHLMERDGRGLSFRIKRLIEREEAAIRSSEEAQMRVGGPKRPLNNPDKGRAAEENREKRPMKLTVDPLAWERLSQIAQTRDVEIGAIVSILVNTAPQALEILELRKAPARLKSGVRTRKAVRVFPEIIEQAEQQAKEGGFKSRGAWLSRLVESFIRNAVTEPSH